MGNVKENLINFIGIRKGRDEDKKKIKLTDIIIRETHLVNASSLFLGDTWASSLLLHFLISDKFCQLPGPTFKKHRPALFLL